MHNPAEVYLFPRIGALSIFRSYAMYVHAVMNPPVVLSACLKPAAAGTLLHFMKNNVICPLV